MIVTTNRYINCSPVAVTGDVVTETVTVDLPVVLPSRLTITLTEPDSSVPLNVVVLNCTVNAIGVITHKNKDYTPLYIITYLHHQ